MATIRKYRHNDLDAVYRICLETGASGKDAKRLYRDPKLIGHIYAGAYVTLEPAHAFVLEDDEGVGGYIIGAFDTHAFEQKLEAEWWPPLRHSYADPPSRLLKTWCADDRMAYLIHHPSRTPKRVTENHPSHLHIDLLPRFQGRALGRRMIDAWCEHMRSCGSPGMHLGVGLANERAVRFYRAYGLDVIEEFGPPHNVIFFGKRF
jgi:ribosomal protein S18 acetylase RimI-like enzyme